MLAEFAPELAVYGRPFGTLESDPATRENYRLPITEVIERIDPSVQTLDSEALPDRTELVERVVRRAGWALGDFIAFRASIAYPPMPSSVLLRYRLPSEP